MNYLLNILASLVLVLVTLRVLESLVLSMLAGESLKEWLKGPWR